MELGAVSAVQDARERAGRDREARAAFARLYPELGCRAAADRPACALPQVNKATMNMLRQAEPYVTWGYPNLKTVKELIYKRGFGKVRFQPPSS